jgi:hypothetical protein
MTAVEVGFLQRVFIKLDDERLRVGPRFSASSVSPEFLGYALGYLRASASLLKTAYGPAHEGGVAPAARK